MTFHKWMSSNNRSYQIKIDLFRMNLGVDNFPGGEGSQFWKDCVSAMLIGVIASRKSVCKRTTTTSSKFTLVFCVRQYVSLSFRCCALFVQQELAD